MKSRIITLQFALFFKDVVERPDIEFSDLNTKMLNAFDAMPQLTPVPRELPVDIPVMILRSEKNDYNCNISRKRLDLILNRVDDKKANSEILKDFNAKVLGLTKYIIDKQQIIRFGIVARYFHRDNTATHTLRKKFFTSAVEGADEMGLRYNKKSESFGFEINDIIEISSADAVTSGVVEKGIFIQRDINNTPRNDNELDLEILSKISEKYSSRLSETSMEALLK